jgi:hypothetical protein
MVGALGLHPAAGRAQRRDDQRENEHETSNLQLHAAGLSVKGASALCGIHIPGR